MTPLKKQRLIFVLISVTCITAAVLLALQGLRDRVVFFYAPSEMAHVSLKPAQVIRIGGLVETGSVTRASGNHIAFRITDGAASMTVAYQGLLPALFREGQGVVAEGTLSASGTFTASSILAKHDENYMPPEVADSLKKTGHWKEKMEGNE